MGFAAGLIPTTLSAHFARRAAVILAVGLGLAAVGAWSRPSAFWSWVMFVVGALAVRVTASEPLRRALRDASLRALSLIPPRASLALLDAAGWAREAWVEARRALAVLTTVRWDPLGRNGDLIPLPAPLLVKLADGSLHRVSAMRVSAATAAHQVAPETPAHRAVTWFYREFPEPTAAEWRRCARAAGLPAPPPHVLDLYGEDRAALDLQVWVQVSLVEGDVGVERTLAIGRRGGAASGRIDGAAFLDGMSARGFIRDAVKTAGGSVPSGSAAAGRRRRAE